MAWNPLNKIRERLNSGVSARVDAQLAWRDESINARLDALERSMSGLQGAMTTLSVSISDRVLTVEAAADHLLRENTGHGSSGTDR